MNGRRLAVFPAQLHSLHEMLAFVLDSSVSFDVSEDVMAALELALEEAFVNIITHGQLEPHDAITIECTLLANPKAIIIAIRDRGKPFDPESHRKMRCEGCVDPESIGGHGISLMYASLDGVAYRREGSENALYLLKRL